MVAISPPQGLVVSLQHLGKLVDTDPQGGTAIGVHLLLELVDIRTFGESAVKLRFEDHSEPYAACK